MQNTQFDSTFLAPENPDLPPIQNELSWGKSYRDWHMAEPPTPLKQKPSPVNIPFKICRALSPKKKKVPPKAPQCKQDEKVTLLDRSAFSQPQYMDLLATPQSKATPGVKKKKKKKKKKDACRCHIEPCPPRIIQMAVPNKRLVWENWKMYEKTVPTEVITRYDELLKSGFNNLNVPDARYYFKQLNRKKRKKLKEAKKMKKKKEEEKSKGEQEWVKKKVDEIADAIMEYYVNVPKFILNFQQLLISENIIDMLKTNNLAKVNKRNTKHHGKKVLIEMCDKIAKSIDDLNLFAMVKPGDQFADSAVIYEPSVEEFGEGEFEGSEGGGEAPGPEGMGEGEEPFYGEEEFEGGSFGGGMGGPGTGGDFAGSEGDYGEESEWEDIDGGGAGGGTTTESTTDQGGFDESEFEAGAGGQGEDGFDTIIHEIANFPGAGMGEGEEGVNEFIPIGLDRDTLDKLIEILSNSPADFLASEIGTVPGVTYGDILQKLKDLRDGTFDVGGKPKPFLEDLIVDWAKKIEPEEVDDPLLNKIHETSKALDDWIKNTFVEDVGPISGVGAIDQIKPGAPPTIDEDIQGEEAASAAEGGAQEGGEGASTVVGEEGVIEGAHAGSGAGIAPGSGAPAEGADVSEVGGSVAEGAAAAEGGEAEGSVATAGEVPGAEGPAGEEGSAAGGTAAEVGSAAGGPGAEEGSVAGGSAVAAGIEGVEGAVAGAAEEAAAGGAESEVAEGAAAGGEEGEDGKKPGEVGEGGEGAEGEGVEGEESEKVEGEETEGEEGEGEEGEETEGEEGEGEGAEGEAAEGEAAEGEEIGEEGEAAIGEKPPPTEVGEEVEGAIAVLPGEEPQFPSISGMIIKGHQPPETFEHTPGTICCLSLKLWAYWLLEISNNTHQWTAWVCEIIKQVRQFVAIIRGDVKGPNGQPRVLFKEEWRQFVRETEERSIAWRQYTNHVKELSNEIMGTVRGKSVKCCPKCLQDHMIRNVTAVHETIQALAEAINCAEYWYRALDKIVQQTKKLTDIDTESVAGSELSSAESGDSDDYILEELDGEESSDSFEIEEEVD